MKPFIFNMLVPVLRPGIGEALRPEWYLAVKQELQFCGVFKQQSN